MRFAALIAVAIAAPVFAQSRTTETGKVTFKAIDDQSTVAERYRLEPYEFEYQLRHKRELTVSGIDIYDLTFPSPVKTKHEANNTVYAEYFVPKGKGPFPGVLLLDILDGSQIVSHGIATILTSQKIAALCIHMPYYGPRKPKDEKVRLISSNIEQSLEGIRQAVLDNRCATAWLESRPEIDAKKLGIHGTSLGSFVAAVTSASEPRLNKVSLMLGGGDLVEAYWQHPQAKPYLQVLGIWGADKETLKKAIAPADPITYAENLKKRDLLMIAASRDDVVPPAAAKALWEATGKQKIVWLNATHVGAAVYLFDATDHIVKHFK